MIVESWSCYLTEHFNEVVICRTTHDSYLQLQLFIYSIILQLCMLDSLLLIYVNQLCTKWPNGISLVSGYNACSDLHMFNLPRHSSVESVSQKSKFLDEYRLPHFSSAKVPRAAVSVSRHFEIKGIEWKLSELCLKIGVFSDRDIEIKPASSWELLESTS